MSIAVRGLVVVPSASLTRPSDTTAYASGDLVANSTTAGSVVPLSFAFGDRPNGRGGMIRRVRLMKSNTSLTSASFRVHFYSAAPTVVNGDNGAWSTNQAANYIGAMDVTLDRTFTDGTKGNGIPVLGAELNFAGTQILYALIEARAAYTPASAEVFTLRPEIHLY